MYKNAVLFYFSGTGNTKLVTDRIADTMEASGIKCTKVSIVDIENYDLESFDLVGVGYPIYGFSSPSIVSKFIKNLPAGKQNMFFYKTGGGVHKFNNSASHYLTKRAKKKGFNVVSDFFYLMPSNWLVGYTIGRCKNIYLNAVDKAGEDVKKLISGEKSFNKYSFFLKILCHYIGFHEEQFGARLFGRFLKIDKSCNKCGLCMKECPTQNITDYKFGYKCIWCMKCIYACPQKSIRARFFKAAVLKNGYDVKQFTV